MKKILTLLITILYLILFSSCGSPKTIVKVRNNSDGSQTNISVKQGDGGSTSVNVSPNLSVQFKADSTTLNLK